MKGPSLWEITQKIFTTSKQPFYNYIFSSREHEQLGGGVKNEGSLDQNVL